MNMDLRIAYYLLDSAKANLEKAVASGNRARIAYANERLVVAGTRLENRLNA
tara:strand:+ start:3758 stop:3913 length:156 start_codon:yes stop_codon:yes gene_type:complete